MVMPLRTPVSEGTFPDAVDRALQEAVASVEPTTLRGILEDAVTGGKRVRPLLTALACAAAGGNERDTLSAGVALELLHVSSLVHDDIMDQADTRRGRPTVVATHGPSVAILAGDALVALSFRTMQSLDHPRKDQIVQVLTSAFLSLCEGQCADVCNSIGVRGEPCTHSWMVERKTARLIEACTRIGGLLGGAPPEQVEALATYGLSIGLAYQATDDLLDATGTERETGKSTGLDERNGRTTFLTLAHSDQDRIEHLQAVIGKYTRDACEALDALPSTPARSRLLELAHGLTGRRS